jgi:heme exporter protein C
MEERATLLEDKEIEKLTVEDLPVFLEESKLHKVLTIIAAISILISIYLAFIFAPVEKVMGVVQKIFYFHVGSAWNAFLAFFIVFILSIAYLITRKRKFDIYAGISAEIGVVFTLIVLITGPIWARSSWNTWWTWEPRLTTTLILLFIYLAYIMIRKMEGPWDKKARLAAIFGIIGFIDVPIVFMAIRWWESKLHPIVFGEGPSQTGGGIETTMLIALIVTTISLTLLYVVLLQKGVNIEKAKLRVQEFKEKIQGNIIN